MPAIGGQFAALSHLFAAMHSLYELHHRPRYRQHGDGQNEAGQEAIICACILASTSPP